MPTYRPSVHAVQRIQERFPELGLVLTSWEDWSAWLTRAAERAKVVMQPQRDLDLMLRVEVTLAIGRSVMYLPVRPLTGGRDRWIITTVLTSKQGEANLRLFGEQRRENERAAWEAYRQGGRSARVHSRLATRRAQAA